MSDYDSMTERAMSELDSYLTSDTRDVPCGGCGLAGWECVCDTFADEWEDDEE